MKYIILLTVLSTINILIVNNAEARLTVRASYKNLTEAQAQCPQLCKQNDPSLAWDGKEWYMVEVAYCTCVDPKRLPQPKSNPPGHNSR